jgi:tetratricopeptide (TPR) repeat protein
MGWLRWLQSQYRQLAAAYYHAWGVLHRYVGNAAALHSEYVVAIDDFTRAIQWNPALAQAYLDRGILYWREMDHPRRAIQDLTTALDLDATLLEARFNRGIAHQQLREYAEAVADYRAYLAEGDHPYWCEYAESMMKELSEWVSPGPGVQ